ncbi:MAG: antitoxin [Betaproteobacteria bacterium]|nr:antitoxin [Betaproteobacteria bacterium]
MLQAAKERARREKKTAGEVISELARRALNAPPQATAERAPKALHGLRPFPKRGGIVTNELIDKLREEDAY